MRFPREEALPVATLLAFAGGYLDAYTWITHRVFANAQTANMLFLWIHAMAGEWVKALHYVPSLAAFAFGVVMASWLRRVAGANAGPISLLIEIAFLILVAVLHNRLPDVAGTLGISFVAAMQAASFPRVESWAYSSVMATTNLRQTIEGLFIVVSGSPEPRPFRRPSVFGAICASFGLGAALGAYVTLQVPALTLGIPVALLLIALLMCEERAPESVAS
ncbi:MAG: YoaK family protein [Bradyrhizobium sp.]